MAKINYKKGAVSCKRLLERYLIYLKIIIENNALLYLLQKYMCCENNF